MEVDSPQGSLDGPVWFHNTQTMTLVVAPDIIHSDDDISNCAAVPFTEEDIEVIVYYSHHSDDRRIVAVNFNKSQLNETEALNVYTVHATGWQQRLSGGAFGLADKKRRGAQSSASFVGRHGPSGSLPSFLPPPRAGGEGPTSAATVHRRRRVEREKEKEPHGGSAAAAAAAALKWESSQTLPPDDGRPPFTRVTALEFLHSLCRSDGWGVLRESAKQEIAVQLQAWAEGEVTLDAVSRLLFSRMGPDALRQVLRSIAASQIGGAPVDPLDRERERERSRLYKMVGGMLGGGGADGSRSDIQARGHGTFKQTNLAARLEDERFSKGLKQYKELASKGINSSSSAAAAAGGPGVGPGGGGRGGPAPLGGSAGRGARGQVKAERDRDADGLETVRIDVLKPLDLRSESLRALKAVKRLAARGPQFMSRATSRGPGSAWTGERMLLQCGHWQRMHHFPLDCAFGHTFLRDGHRLLTFCPTRRDADDLDEREENDGGIRGAFPALAGAGAQTQTRSRSPDGDGPPLQVGSESRFANVTAVDLRSSAAASAACSGALPPSLPHAAVCLVKTPPLREVFRDGDWEDGGNPFEYSGGGVWGDAPAWVQGGRLAGCHREGSGLRMCMVGASPDEDARAESKYGSGTVGGGSLYVWLLAIDTDRNRRWWYRLDGRGIAPCSRHGHRILPFPPPSSHALAHSDGGDLPVTSHVIVFGGSVSVTVSPPTPAAAAAAAEIGQSQTELAGEAAGSSFPGGGGEYLIPQKYFFNDLWTFHLDSCTWCKVDVQMPWQNPSSSFAGQHGWIAPPGRELHSMTWVSFQEFVVFGGVGSPSQRKGPGRPRISSRVMREREKRSTQAHGGQHGHEGEEGHDTDGDVDMINGGQDSVRERGERVAAGKKAEEEKDDHVDSSSSSTDLWMQHLADVWICRIEEETPVRDSVSLVATWKRLDSGISGPSAPWWSSGGGSHGSGLGAGAPSPKSHGFDGPDSGSEAERERLRTGSNWRKARPVPRCAHTATFVWRRRPRSTHPRSSREERRASRTGDGTRVGDGLAVPNASKSDLRSVYVERLLVIIGGETDKRSASGRFKGPKPVRHWNGETWVEPETQKQWDDDTSGYDYLCLVDQISVFSLDTHQWWEMNPGYSTDCFPLKFRPRAGHAACLLYVHLPTARLLEGDAGGGALPKAAAESEGEGGAPVILIHGGYDETGLLPDCWALSLAGALVREPILKDARLAVTANSGPVPPLHLSAFAVAERGEEVEAALFADASGFLFEEPFRHTEPFISLQQRRHQRELRKRVAKKLACQWDVAKSKFLLRKYLNYMQATDDPLLEPFRDRHAPPAPADGAGMGAPMDPDRDGGGAGGTNETDESRNLPRAVGAVAASPSRDQEKEGGVGGTAASPKPPTVPPHSPRPSTRGAAAAASSSPFPPPSPTPGGAAPGGGDGDLSGGRPPLNTADVLEKFLNAKRSCIYEDPTPFTQWLHATGGIELPKECMRALEENEWSTLYATAQRRHVQWREQRMAEKAGLALSGRVMTANLPQILASTSPRQWPFGAIGHLVDNALSRDVNAECVYIRGLTSLIHYRCLVVEDNGRGMTPGKVTTLLRSFGRTDPFVAAREALTRPRTTGSAVAEFGLGFKMAVGRLGNGCLVMSRTAKRLTVGLFSSQLLLDCDLKDVQAPMLSLSVEAGVSEFPPKALRTMIGKYAPFAPDELVVEVQRLLLKSRGTRLIFFGLRRDVDGFGFMRKTAVLLKARDLPPDRVNKKMISESDRQRERRKREREEREKAVRVAAAARAATTVPRASPPLVLPSVPLLTGDDEAPVFPAAAAVQASLSAAPAPAGQIESGGDADVSMQDVGGEGDGQKGTKRKRGDGTGGEASPSSATGGGEGQPGGSLSGGKSAKQVKREDEEVEAGKGEGQAKEGEAVPNGGVEGDGGVQKEAEQPKENGKNQGDSPSGPFGALMNSAPASPSFGGSSPAAAPSGAADKDAAGRGESGEVEKGEDEDTEMQQADVGALPSPVAQAFQRKPNLTIQIPQIKVTTEAGASAPPAPEREESQGAGVSAPQSPATAGGPNPPLSPGVFRRGRGRPPKDPVKRKRQWMEQARSMYPNATEEELNDLYIQTGGGKGSPSPTPSPSPQLANAQPSSSLGKSGSVVAAAAAAVAAAEGGAVTRKGPQSSPLPSATPLSQKPPGSPFPPGGVARGARREWTVGDRGVAADKGKQTRAHTRAQAAEEKNRREKLRGVEPGKGDRSVSGHAGGFRGRGTAADFVVSPREVPLRWNPSQPNVVDQDRASLDFIIDALASGGGGMQGSSAVPLRFPPDEFPFWRDHQGSIDYNLSTYLCWLYCFSQRSIFVGDGQAAPLYDPDGEKTRFFHPLHNLYVQRRNVKKKQQQQQSAAAAAAGMPQPGQQSLFGQAPHVAYGPSPSPSPRHFPPEAPGAPGMLPGMPPGGAAGIPPPPPGGMPPPPPPPPAPHPVPPPFLPPPQQPDQSPESASASAAQQQTTETAAGDPPPPAEPPQTSSEPQPAAAPPQAPEEAAATGSAPEAPPSETAPMEDVPASSSSQAPQPEAQQPTEAQPEAASAKPVKLEDPPPTSDPSAPSQPPAAEPPQPESGADSSAAPAPPSQPVQLPQTSEVIKQPTPPPRPPPPPPALPGQAPGRSPPWPPVPPPLPPIPTTMQPPGAPSRGAPSPTSMNVHPFARPPPHFPPHAPGSAPPVFTSPYPPFVQPQDAHVVYPNAAYASPPMQMAAPHRGAPSPLRPATPHMGIPMPPHMMGDPSQSAYPQVPPPMHGGMMGGPRGPPPGAPHGGMGGMGGDGGDKSAEGFMGGTGRDVRGPGGTNAQLRAASPTASLYQVVRRQLHNMVENPFISDPREFAQGAWLLMGTLNKGDSPEKEKQQQQGGEVHGQEGSSAEKDKEIQKVKTEAGEEAGPTEATAAAAAASPSVPSASSSVGETRQEKEDKEKGKESGDVEMGDAPASSSASSGDAQQPQAATGTEASAGGGDVAMEATGGGDERAGTAAGLKESGAMPSPGSAPQKEKEEAEKEKRKKVKQTIRDCTFCETGILMYYNGRLINRLDVPFPAPPEFHNDFMRAGGEGYEEVPPVTCLIGVPSWLVPAPDKQQFSIQHSVTFQNFRTSVLRVVAQYLKVHKDPVALEAFREGRKKAFEELDWMSMLDVQR
uniref:CW-type domain-containing protein n=1 Tax=Chromera velia CCMP2878 TaxID=1169474 RepID=A0A0G4GKR2_9ALVE|eukprot:Cvel_4837.t1-p1 / transcript=Cvel_4837.t1 / gene=Cvel_4837 / organism=Chromera_velia_CCMP2878 / gene_product=MORC family CW-type zinc finger protein 4, putative / transcript_product=MORC family CW-type zinc finger protein 4, putative / location=Cvel_scaffold218:15320-32645(-) / protein_length=3167 / sequence_SO=supercontig / SO=protein_coding / is_pseudo=false